MTICPLMTSASSPTIYSVIKNGIWTTGFRCLTSSLRTLPWHTSAPTEEEAVKRGYSIQVSRLPAAAIPRARTLQHIDGMLKVIVNAHTGRIMGCTLFCVDAPEVINLVALAMKNDLHYSVLRDFIFTHPSMSEGLNDLFKAF